MKHYLLPLLLLCASCASHTPVVVEKQVLYEKPVFVPPVVPPVTQDTVPYVIITKKNVDQIIKDDNTVVYAVTPDGWKKLEGNIAIFREYVEKQNGIIKGYVEYYKPTLNP